VKQLPAFCRVALTLKPSGDSEIKMELWLPLEGWNGKFMAAGSFGWGGSIMYDGLYLGLKNGYAVANNDTGHTSSNSMGVFALGHPDKLIDYGYRANHEMTLKSKAVITSYYGAAPKHSYWVGCSLGGQQGLTEIQRFPEDYDGAVIGSPASPITRLNAFQIWPALLIQEKPERAISQSKKAMLQQAVVNACDELDGVKDGVIENPLLCRFKLSDLQCKGADEENCLTVAQIEMLHKLYDGPKNPRTGEQIYAGMAPGAEGMAQISSANPMNVATALYADLVFQNPDWDWKTFNLDTDISLAEKVLGPINMTSNPDLKPFFAHSGKLILYHGWADFSSPVESINYYKDVVKTVGPAAQDSMRVFGMPGVGHCAGGDGCDQFDKLGVIDTWVENGKAPDRIEASKSDGGKVIRTHPLCAYPLSAHYKGSGSIDDASNFDCAAQ
jgi:feruloyl esterase